MPQSIAELRRRAQANADYFQRPYYLVKTTLGLRVEREKPKPEGLYQTFNPTKAA